MKLHYTTARLLAARPTLTLILAFTLALASCGRSGAGNAEPVSASWTPELGSAIAPDAQASPTWSAVPGQFAPAEVREYHGKPLTPRASLRDNSIAGPQYPDLASYRLSVSGLVDTPLSLTYDQVLALPRAEKLITLHCVEGWSADMLWTGTLLKEILELAGAQERADTLVFVCLDGYETSMEVRHARDKNIILAWATNGLPLVPENGAPFQVAAEDKWGYKWAKWVKEIRVYQESDYKGYWESRGYSVRGELWQDFSAPLPEQQERSEFE